MENNVYFVVKSLKDVINVNLQANALNVKERQLYKAILAFVLHRNSLMNNLSVRIAQKNVHHAIIMKTVLDANKAMN